MATKAHLEGNRRYLEKQDSILIRIPKGRKAELQAHAKKQGESLNGFIVRAEERNDTHEPIHRQIPPDQRAKPVSSQKEMG